MGKRTDVLTCMLVLLIANFLPAQTAPADNNYSDIIRQSILHDYPGMLHNPTGALSFPFIMPGSVYANELWDWDSWLSDVALVQIMTDQGQHADKGKMLSFGRGCVMNFLKAAEPDGSMPIRIQVRVRSADPPAPTAGANSSNMHKPILAQHTAFLTKLDNGNAEWIREQFPVLQKFLSNYRERQRHVVFKQLISGLSHIVRA
jgi:hypothetical protein